MTDKIQTLSVATVLSLFNPGGLYLVAYGFLFGMSVWISFFGGVIAYRTLARPQFGALQHRTFPIYFVLSLGLASMLLGLWTVNHPDVQTHYGNPLVADVAQAYTLALVILSQGSNYFIACGSIDEQVSGLCKVTAMDKRTKVKVTTNPGVSDRMKALNGRFGMLHGISSLANLGAVLALGFHGLWIGNFGLKA
ncbi:Transmembrane protein 205 [Mycena venus]|uniref:Transmembrane protein 205 n=1 Tax=Mycena venus TaxID=2733690 RepID=A0A8H6XGB2_9AGAR|nr:Transmembrane protein 205 [Mycena venus]